MDRVLEAIADRIAELQLSEEDARKLALEPICRRRDNVPGVRPANALGVYDPSDREGYAIPYFDTAGRPTGHHNVRFLAHGDGAPKYLTPKGSRPRAYFPRTEAGPQDWTAADQYPRKLLVITEGEFKAVKATSVGLPTVAVPGVDCVSGKSQGRQLVPGLEDLPLRELDVVVIFDSDIVNKPEVRSAMQRAEVALLHAGAKSVASVTLPADPGEKVGLDDYLQGHEVAELLALPREAGPLARGLARLNDRYVFMAQGQGKVFLRTNPEATMSPQAFMLAEPETVLVGKREVKIARLWLESRDKTAVHSLVYEPGRGRMIVEGEVSYYNVWRGLGCEPSYQIDGEAFTLWHQLLEHVFGVDDAERRWFEQWLAYPVQHVGAKLYTCALLWSTHAGVGKGLLAHAMRRVYGPENCAFLREAVLGETFNDWIHSQFVAVEELSGASRNARGATIRDLVTAERVTVNQKYIQPYRANVHANFYFNSNHANPIEVRDNERRVFAYKIKSPPIDPEFASRFAAAFITGEAPMAPSLHKMLLGVDMDGFSPTAPAPKTDALDDMQEATSRPFNSWLRSAEHEWATFCIENHIPQSRELFLAEEIAALYTGKTGERVGRAGAYLSECSWVGIAASQHNRCGLLSLKDGRRKKVYALHNADRWAAASSEEVVEAYHKGLELANGAEI